MTRRLTLPVLLAIALALAVAGCGGGDDGGAKGSLGDSLGYMPKNAALIVTVDTDLSGEQYKNLDRMLAKFPFSGQVKSQVKQGLSQEGVDYEKDVKPILGADVVIGLPDARSIVDDTQEDKYVVVFPGDGDKLKQLMEKDQSSKKAGQIDGADVYESADGSPSLIKGDTLIAADSRPELEAAVKRHDGGDKLTEEDFNAPFEGLPGDAMMRVYGDARGLLLADPSTADAREVKFVDGLRKFGFTATAQRDGVAVDGRVITEGLTAEDLPLAAGDEAPGVARFGDYASATRDLGHSTDWFFQVIAKNEGEDYEKLKKQLGARLGGIDVERDLIEQFSGASTIAGQLDGSWALRSEVKDPAAMRATLEKMRKSKGAGDLTIGEKGGLLTLTDEDGTTYAGMVGDVFVASQESPSRAKEMAAVEPRVLPDTKGAQVFVADGESIAKAIIRRSGQNQAAGLFTGPLGDLTGWVSAAPDGMRMTAKLKVE